MADDTFNPLVWLMDVVADAVDWIHETFSDPALSQELRSDLGIDDVGNPQGQLPTGEKIRMRHPNGYPIDVDKAAFDATVAEVHAAYGLLVDFFGALDLSVAEIWDFLSLIGQVGAAESIRARSPVVYAIARAIGVAGGLVSRDDVGGLNVLRAVDLMVPASGCRGCGGSFEAGARSRHASSSLSKVRRSGLSRYNAGVTDQKLKKPPNGVRRWMASRGIFVSALFVLSALLATGALIWLGLTRLLRDAWPWQVNGLETSTPGFQVMQVVLTLVGGLGAAILVVVAYRRQRDLETARFDDRFAAAAAQLGADTAAERLAGIYAMAALADTWEEHRQQCINVLCAYLRLPYDPSAGLLAEVVSEHTWPVGSGTGKEVRTYRSLPNDREVRHTIIRVICEHLRQTATTPWQGHGFDFTGAVFDGGDFSDARFTSGTVSFARTTFASGRVNFDQAAFVGGKVSFDGARFVGGEVSFGRARFDGGEVSFGRARFDGGKVSFPGAEVVSGSLNFAGMILSSGQVRFEAAQFTGGLINFRAAKFEGGEVSFYLARFAGSKVSFGRTQIPMPPGGSYDPESFAEVKVPRSAMGEFHGGCKVSFDRAEFVGGEVSFDRAQFVSANVSFDRARFVSANVSFEGVEFDSGKFRFVSADFRGGRVNFRGATFAGVEVSFDRARFAGSQVHFGQMPIPEPLRVPGGGTVKFPDFPRGKFHDGCKVSFDRAQFFDGEVSFIDAAFEPAAVIDIPPYDPDMAGWPTRDGKPFYGWPEPATADVGD